MSPLLVHWMHADAPGAALGHGVDGTSGCSGRRTGTHVGETGDYHHGDLPSALLRAVGEIVEAEGVGGVSLRGVARRAGVSHAAPAHHFGDRGGLLAAYAAEGFDGLRAAIGDAVEELGDDATVADAMLAMGRAYISFGAGHRGHYSVMWRKELVDCEAPVLVHAGGRALAALLATVRAALDDGATDHDVLVVAMTAWSTVHGFVSLHLEMPSAEVSHVPDVTPLLDPVMGLLTAGLASHPAWVGHERPATAVPRSLQDPLVPLDEVVAVGEVVLDA